MQQFRVDQHAKKIRGCRAHDPADRIRIATWPVDERGHAPRRPRNWVLFGKKVSAVHLSSPNPLDDRRRLVSA